MITTQQTSSGFTLLEVVIAMGILAIGLLGLASLQATVLKSNASALSRSQATGLARSIIDAMRVNKTAAQGGSYNSGIEANPATCADDVALGANTQTVIAAQDLVGWRNALICTLPVGTGSINCTTVGACTVTIQWDDSHGNGSATQSFVTTTTL